jgi:hypothetical protein
MSPRSPVVCYTHKSLIGYWEESRGKRQGAGLGKGQCEEKGGLDGGIRRSNKFGLKVQSDQGFVELLVRIQTS